MDLVYEVLDESLLCRIGFVQDGQPYVLPTLLVRQGDTLYFHGAQTNRMFRLMAEGSPVCVEATVVDAIVMGRSVFQHSMNYRSVVVLGCGQEVIDRDAKHEAMLALVDRVIPGRASGLRPLSEAELRSTRVIAMHLSECSAKVRTGPGVDNQIDYGSPAWAGELPLRIVAGTPVPDEHVPAATPVPRHVLTWGLERRGV